MESFILAGPVLQPPKPKPQKGLGSAAGLVQ